MKLGIAPTVPNGPTYRKAVEIVGQRDPARFKIQDGRVETFYKKAMPELFADLAGFIYVIVPEGVAGVAKIGLTTGSVEWRMSTLGAGYWGKLRLHAVAAVHGTRIRTFERIAHQCAAKRGARLNGEWFALSGDEALMAIIAAGEKAGAELASVEQAWWRVIVNEIGSPQQHDDDDERRRIMRQKLGID